MNYTAFVQPVRRLGFEQWRAVVTVAGREVWSFQCWSEQQARVACLRQIFKLGRGQS